MAELQLVAVFLWSSIAAGSSLQNEPGHFQIEGKVSLIRRHPLNWEAEVAADGEMRMPMPSPVYVDEIAMMAKNAAADQCDDVFIKAKSGTTTCNDPSKEKPIPDRWHCIAAAGGDINQGFVITELEYDIHPPYCFTKDGKYYWNPTGSNVSATGNITGTPVCMTKLYANGKPNSSECLDDGHEKIATEDECRDAAACLSHCAEPNFRVIAAEQDKYPGGCLIRADDHCYSFNPKLTSKAQPAAGTPVCRQKINRKSMRLAIDQDNASDSNSALMSISGFTSDVKGPGSGSKMA